MPILRVKFNRILSCKEAKEIEDLVGKKLNKKFLKRNEENKKEVLTLKLDDEIQFMNLLDMFVVEFKGIYEGIVICPTKEEGIVHHGYFDPLW
ncbi:MAG: hypothetical protein KGO96_07010 [Elusimicrobia bacterium]|nr:hypothetical protein [Elusimicrobiota bacterium]